MSLLLVQADARHLPFADASVQCCVTSPPYFSLRDYGIAGQIGLETTPEAYVSQLVQVFREVRRVLKDTGVAWCNIGDSFLGDKQLGMIPARVAIALQADGWVLRADVIWAKVNPMPESVKDRPTRAHEYLFLLAKRHNYYYNATAIREPASESTIAAHGGRYAASCVGPRTLHTAPPDHPVRSHPDKHHAGRGLGNGSARDLTGRNKRSVWAITMQPYPGAHFAVMPEKLVEPCILAGSKPGDIVLDPFAGSGTVARVALRLGRRAVGCDLNPAYLRLADERTQVTLGLPLDGAVA